MVLVLVGLWVAPGPAQRFRVGKSYRATFSCAGIGANIHDTAGGDWAVDARSDKELPKQWLTGSVRGTLKVTDTTSRTHTSFDISRKPKLALVGTFTGADGSSVDVTEDFSDEQILCS